MDCSFCSRPLDAKLECQYCLSPSIDAAHEERRIEETKRCTECGTELLTKGNVTFCPDDPYTQGDK